MGWVQPSVVESMTASVGDSTMLADLVSKVYYIGRGTETVTFLYFSPMLIWIIKQALPMTFICLLSSWVGRD